MKSIDFGARFRFEGKVMQRSRFPAIDRVGGKSGARRSNGKRQLRVLVLHDMKLMLIYYGAAFVLNVKSQKRKELIVERLSDAHVFDGYLYVVNDRLHEFQVANINKRGLNGKAHAGRLNGFSCVKTGSQGNALTRERGHDVERKALDRLEFSHVYLLTEPLDSTKFQKPGDAVGAPMV